MYATNHHKATSVADAAAKMSAAEEGKYLGGGQTLLPTMKQHLAAPTDLVDLSGAAELKGICTEDATLVIGAMTTHYEVSTNADVKRLVPALAALAGGIGDPAVRHLGTIGGSLANNDPAADYPAAALALGATIVTNQRRISAEEFFQGMFATALEDGEIITSIRVPATATAAYAKFPNPASRYAMAGVFVAKTAMGVRVAVTGAGDDGVFRHSGMEAALSSNFSVDAIAGVEVSSDGLLSDIHGDATYRAALITAMAKRAVAAA